MRSTYALRRASVPGSQDGLRGVGSLEPRDVGRLPVLKRLRAGDDRVQLDVVAENRVGVELAVRLRGRTELALERPEHILRDDLRVLERRRVVEPPLEVE